MFGFAVHRGAYIKPGIYIFGGYTDYPSGVDPEDPYGLDSILNYDGVSMTTDSLKLSDKMFGNTSNKIKGDIYIFGGYTKQVLDPDYMDTPLPCVNKIQRYNGVSCTTISATINARWQFGSASLNNSIYLFKGVTSPLIFPYSAHLWVGTEKFTGISTVVVNSSVSYSSGNCVEFNSSILDFDKNNSTIREYYGADAFGAQLLSTPTDGKPGVIGSNVYLFGGYRSSAGGYVSQSLIKKWNGSALTTESTAVAWDMSNHSVSSYGGKAYSIGGTAYRSFPNQDVTMLNYVSSYDGATWVGQASTLPSATQMHSSTSISK